MSPGLNFDLHLMSCHQSLTCGPSLSTSQCPQNPGRKCSAHTHPEPAFPGPGVAMVLQGPGSGLPGFEPRSATSVGVPCDVVTTEPLPRARGTQATSRVPGAPSVLCAPAQPHECPSVLQIRTAISRRSLSGFHYHRIFGRSSTFRPGNKPGSDVLSARSLPLPQNLCSVRPPLGGQGGTGVGGMFLAVSR